MHDNVHQKITMAGTVMTSTVTGESYDAGTFTTPSVKELRAQCAPLLAAAEGKQQLKVSHLAVSPGVLELHCLDENAGAMIQAASQFNCLEFAGPSVTPEQGVTGYVYDNTQGPACAIACGPGTVYRNYFTRLGPDGRKGQTHDSQINNLQGVIDALEAARAGGAAGSHALPIDHLLRVRNGYVASDNERLAALNEHIGLADRDALIGELRIGIHSETEVTHETTTSKLEAAKRHKVSQAYCSALSCGYSNGSLQSWEPMATIVQDGTYEATLLAAALEQHTGQGSGRVLLTSIGGGVFGNDDAWIAGAIVRACHRLRDLPLEVVVCHYRSVNPQFKQRIDGALSAMLK